MRQSVHKLDFISLLNCPLIHSITESVVLPSIPPSTRSDQSPIRSLKHPSIHSSLHNNPFIHLAIHFPYRRRAAPVRVWGRVPWGVGVRPPCSVAALGSAAVRWGALARPGPGAEPAAAAASARWAAAWAGWQPGLARCSVSENKKPNS